LIGHSCILGEVAGILSPVNEKVMANANFIYNCRVDKLAHPPKLKMVDALTLIHPTSGKVFQIFLTQKNAQA